MGRIALVFLFLITSTSSFGLVPENIFQNDLVIFDLLGKKAKAAKNYVDVPFDIKTVNAYLSDPKNKVDKLFKVSPYFKEDVKFWFYIYTVFSSYHIVLHDKENLGLIYDVIEYHELKSSNLSEYTKYALQRRLTSEKMKLIKKEFKYLEKNKAKTIAQKKIIQALKKVKFKIPPIGKKRRKAFKELASNLRSQTGQKDFLQKGLENFATYEPTFNKWLKYFDLPKELIWISFLESSFNTRAKSKVGATGVWQFMRRIGKYFLPYNRHKDGRLNPLLSTLGAFHLLHQNKKILKSWDLAIPAYNSGTKHLLKARRKLGGENVSLQKILESYEHPHFGFASKNFYSEFIALSHAMAYRDVFYKNVKSKGYSEVFVYLTKCKIKKSWFISQLKRGIPKIKEFNSHLKSRKRSYPKGTILFSPSNLTKRRYLKLTMKQLRRSYPKNYKKYVSRYSCSTK